MMSLTMMSLTMMSLTMMSLTMMSLTMMSLTMMRQCPCLVQPAYRLAGFMAAALIWIVACALRRWAIDHEAYQGRVSSIPLVFDAAAQDLGKPGVDAEVVEAVWGKLMPGEDSMQ
jgi:hypothetical protein